MHISMLDQAGRVRDARGALLHQIAVLSAKPDDRPHYIGMEPFAVIIDGVAQDDTIVELVRPIVLGELRARVRRLDADLAQLGIEVG